MFPHSNIYKNNWTSSDGKTRKQIDHILIVRRRHSGVFDADRSGEQIVILINVWWWQI
jgi:hypothetical protein